MARYIDADALIDYIRQNVMTSSRDSAECKEFMIDHIGMEWFAPTADVVPRAEVEQIFAEIDNALHDMAMEYHEAGLPVYFAVCEMVHHKVMRPIEKKYIGDKQRKEDGK